MSFTIGLDDHAIYRWYEASEEPLWEEILQDYGIPWWLREDAVSPETQWLAKAYPALAPYFPYFEHPDQNTDPTLQYMGYWWP